MQHDADTRERSPGYLWFDAEFSSLDLDNAQLLQVALLATDADLNRIGPPEDDFNIHLRIEDEDAISPWVREHIPEVIERCHSDDARSVAECNSLAAAWIDLRFGPADPDITRRPLIAGNSVHNDWALARRLLPDLVARCHYRLFDVSGLKTFFNDQFSGPEFDKDDSALVRQWFPGFHGPETMKAHDALFDVQASVAELTFIRAHMQRAT